MKILALNCGSSSIKYQIYDWKRMAACGKGSIERIGLSGSKAVQQSNGATLEVVRDCPDHRAALALATECMTDPERGIIASLDEIKAVGHRVVHGGSKFRSSTLITAEVLDTIKQVASLAPLHNPPNILGIESAQALMPGVPHIAVFDTAFHQTMPMHAYLYAVPFEWYEKYEVRRYGFHGTSHLYVSRRAAVMLGKPVRETSVITLHIGNGVSITAVKNGQSIDTSMGMTPLEGAVMGTRSGDLDPAIVPFMKDRLGISSAGVVDLLNKKSGLLGISGRFSDVRNIREEACQGNPRCRLALQTAVYRLKKYIGAYAAVLGGPDAVVFTAGVGENSALVRAGACEGLEYMGVKIDIEKNERESREERDISADSSRVRIFVIPTNEEIVFIEDVASILEGNFAGHINHTYSFERGAASAAEKASAGPGPQPCDRRNPAAAT